ncbi:hypothetical protein [Sphingomonas antarctica]|uniref:hypothetical protein n=1 Tax=Sphingomonas antarctica TaxID=2040274 RepID=UPI0039ED5008
MLDQNNAAIGSDEQNHGTARLIGQLVGGLAIPTGLEGVGIKAGTEALRGGASMAEARTIAARAVGQRMIATNTAYGVAHGAGSADTLGDAAKGALVEGTIGAVTGGVLAKAGETLAPKLAERALAARAAPMTPAQQLTQETQKFVAAADRQDIGFMAADLPNATKSRFATAVAGITLGGIPLADRATELIGQAKAARDAIAARLAGGVDNVTDKTGAGQAAQKGAREWMTTTEAKGQALEDALPIDAKAKVQLGESRAALRYLTTGMESNPELSKIWTENPRLKATLDALTPKEIMEPGKPAQKGGTGFGVDIEGTPAVPAKGTGKAEGGELEWKDMRRLRTIVGQIVGQPGLSSDGAAIDGLRNLYGALSRDMEATAAATSPRALTQFGRVNQFWRGRQSRIDNVLSDVLGSDGKKDPQKAFEAIQRLGNAQGGQPIKLAQTLRSMPTDEADSVRATIIGHLGDAAAGKQTKDGDVFSPATFATKWNGMSPRAKSILFQGQHAKDLDDIARVMDGMKAAGQFANVSKTSIATSAMATMGSGWLNPFVPVVASALQFGGGKLLANQTVARWIAGALKKPNPKAGFTAIQGLTKIARAEPAIANEVFSLQSRLASAFTLPPTSLAANEGDNHR